MKVRFKFAKRARFYTTFIACAASLWLMVFRFNLSVEDLVSYALVSLVLLALVMVAAAALALVIRFLRK